MRKRHGRNIIFTPLRAQYPRYGMKSWFRSSLAVLQKKKDHHWLHSLHLQFSQKSKSFDIYDENAGPVLGKSNETS